jgi:hypothetical protein
MDPHRLAELRSIAYHRRVGERLLAEPGLIELARARLAQWERDGRCATAVAARWHGKLALPPRDLESFLGRDDDEARELRQSTPFAGVLDPRERWALWRRVAAEAGASAP